MVHLSYFIHALLISRKIKKINKKKTKKQKRKTLSSSSSSAMALSPNPGYSGNLEKSSPKSHAIIVHESANLPPPLQFYLSNFTEWGSFQNRFSQFASPPSYSVPTFSSRMDIIPLQEVYMDDLSIASLIPKKVRNRLRRAPVEPIEVSDDFLFPEWVPSSGPSRVPQTIIIKDMKNKFFIKLSSIARNLRPLNPPLLNLLHQGMIFFSVEFVERRFIRM